MSSECVLFVSALTTSDIPFTSRQKAGMVMRDLLQALDCLQENGVIHRDIKPENLLAERSEWPSAMKLTDFGLAHVMQRPEERVRGQLGSALFAAPEVLADRNRRSHAS